MSEEIKETEQQKARKQTLDPTRWSESKRKNTSLTDIYRSYDGNTEQGVRDFFEGKNIHCVKCKDTLDLATAPINYPVNNALSLRLKKEDGSFVQGVPYFQCACEYNNSFLKLLQQVKIPKVKMEKVPV